MLSTPSDAELGADALKSHGWLSRMPEDFQQALLARCQWRRSAAGETLFHAGSEGGMVGLAVGSVLGVSAKGPVGAPAFHLGHAGLWTGHHTLLTGEPRFISLSAHTPVLWALAPLKSVAAMLDSHPAWWRHVAQLAEEQCEMMVNALADMTINDSTQRCVAVLLRLAGRRYPARGDSDRVELPLSQNDLAAMATMSRNTMGNALRQLAGAGFIELRYGTVTLLDVVRLRALIGAD